MATLSAPILWTLRLALVALLFSASDPLRMAAAVMLLSVQLPVQRAVLAWDHRQSRAAARADARLSAG